ncbi:hypothetical protein EDB85DRAFT_1921988, partial [Lactarius pseudohatsudake]
MSWRDIHLERPARSQSRMVAFPIVPVRTVVVRRVPFLTLAVAVGGVDNNEGVPGRGTFAGEIGFECIVGDGAQREGEGMIEGTVGWRMERPISILRRCSPQNCRHRHRYDMRKRIAASASGLPNNGPPIVSSIIRRLIDSIGVVGVVRIGRIQ